VSVSRAVPGPRRRSETPRVETSRVQEAPLAHPRPTRVCCTRIICDGPSVVLPYPRPVGSVPCDRLRQMIIGRMRTLIVRWIQIEYVEVSLPYNIRCVRMKGSAASDARRCGQPMKLKFLKRFPVPILQISV